MLMNAITLSFARKEQGDQYQTDVIIAALQRERSIKAIILMRGQSTQESQEKSTHTRR